MHDSKFRQLFIQSIGITALLLIAIGGFVAIVDPYQQYHKADNAYCGNQRREIAGVAHHHDYDAFFTGSSMSMNHYPEQIDSLWGWKAKNFSIMGATYEDYAVILPYVLSKGKAKNVILNIDPFSFARERVAVDKYLYDDNILNDYEYLYNYTSLKTAIDYLRHPLPEKNLYHFNSPFGRDILKKSYNSKKNTDGFEGENYDYDKLQDNFDNSLLNTIRESSDSIHWHIYYPPYSIGEFVLLHKFGDLDDVLRFKEYSIRQLLQTPNVDLYDFQVSPWITNLDQYMDLRHHSHTYNREIIQSIHDSKYRIDTFPVSMSSRLKELAIQYRDSLENL